ncbi:uncharacterized protein LOC134464212 [Engraulis encrasicolus]|uniref:uncharacterized protein LOC134464212 n=1 Tax=Engraulis encrasicolus TaxID=184585 RepID=UPI002FD0F1D1
MGHTGLSSKTLYGPTNGEVTLKPGVEGVIDDILWKHKGNKVVDWDLTAGAAEYLRFKGRTQLNTKTADVTIQSLTKEDNGLYEAEVQIAGLLRHKQLELKVIDPVTEANVTCETSDAMTTLHCVAVGDNLTYSWSGPGLPTVGMSGQTGPQISHENQDSVYTCNVSNPVGHGSVSFHARDCFGKRGQPYSEDIGAIIGGGVTAVALMVALAVGVWCCCKKRKEKGNNKDTDKNTTQQGHPGNPVTETIPLLAVNEKDTQQESCPTKSSSDTVVSERIRPVGETVGKFGGGIKKEIVKSSSAANFSCTGSRNSEVDKQNTNPVSKSIRGQFASFGDPSAGDGNVLEQTDPKEDVCEPEKGEDIKEKNRHTEEEKTGGAEEKTGEHVVAAG